MPERTGGTRAHISHDRGYQLIAVHVVQHGKPYRLFSGEQLAVALDHWMTLLMTFDGSLSVPSLV